MEETLHQLHMPVRRRFKLGPACIACLLTLSAAGLALVAWTASQHGPLVGTQDDEARVSKEYLPRDQGTSPSGSLQEILAHPDLIPSHSHPLVGRQAPDFELADPEGKAWNLRGLLGSGPVVLIFYQGSWCDHCVRQLFDVNRDLPVFREVGARVVAISADPPEFTRRRFRQYGPFGFPVLSDPGNKVAQAYQVFRPAQGGKQTVRFFLHGTFLLDREGTVQWVNVGDAPFRRNAALLSQLARMEGCSPLFEAGP